MRLGIVLTTDRHLDEVLGIVRAAAARRHSVAIFATDEATRLLLEPRFVGLSSLPDVTVAYCALSADRCVGEHLEVPAAVRRGGQFENAILNQESDKVIVL